MIYLVYIRNKRREISTLSRAVIAHAKLLSRLVVIVGDLVRGGEDIVRERSERVVG